MSVFRCLLAATVSVGIMLAASSSGYAQDAAMRAEGDKACSADANRLCTHVLGQGDMIVLKCFKNRRTKLSAGCHAFLKKVGQLK